MFTRPRFRRRPPPVFTGVAIAAVVLAAIAQAGLSGAASLRLRATPMATDGTAVDVPVDGSPAYRTLPSTALTEAIDRLLDGEPGVYGVVIMTPDGTELYRRNSEVPFVAASLYKLILMADIARGLDSGALLPDQPLYVAPEYYNSVDGTDAYFDPAFAGYFTTVDEALFATGAYSSNVAAKALLSVTTLDSLNGVAQELGLAHTTLFSAPEANGAWPPGLALDTTVADIATAEALVRSYATDGQVNLTTPHDMARFFAMLLAGEVFNERVSEVILEILQQQVVIDRFPALLPKAAGLMHKTGNLDHVVHDVGIIYADGEPVILAALVQAPEEEERAAQVIQRLALIAYGVLDVPPMSASPLAGASPIALPALTNVPDSSDGTAVDGR